ncbi:MAG: hypothetical protein Q9213_005131 [Squamulea squamosa]
MSLKIKHLNGDTTFLLTFSPAEPRLSLNRYGHPSGTFSVLVDPWLSGPSSMWHPKFLLSKHTVPSCISSLSQIPDPNVVLVSQDKPDHCHEPTLRQLDPKSSLTNILAIPAAAKKIRGMKHFDPNRVHSLPAYSSKDDDSIVRFYIPPLTPGGTAGEATIAYIPAKMDVSGLHNAIGITYRPPTAAPFPTQYSPPSSTYTNFSSPNPLHYQLNNMPPTPPDSPNQRPRSLSASTNPSTISTTSSTTSSPAISQTSSASTVPTTSHSLHAHSPSFHSPSFHTHTHTHSTSSASSTHHPRPAKTLSVIYSPHGVAYSPYLSQYATTHLISHAALPLTALIHGFDRVENPWYMGGNVNAGLPGGVEIAKNLMARCWVGAHDEDKENSGVSVLKIRMRKYGLGEVRESVRKEWSGGGGGGCEVRALNYGEELVMRS